MKFTLRYVVVPLLIFGFVLLFKEKNSVKKTPPVVVESVNEEPDVPPVVVPPPPPVVITPVEPVEEKQIKKLPDGEFITRVRLSEMTDDGVKSIPKGKRVKYFAGMAMDGKVSVKAELHQLSDNPDDEIKEEKSNSIILVPSPPVTEIPVVQAQPVSTVRADTSSLDNQIKELEEEIKTIKNAKHKKINATGAQTAKMEIELQNLKARRAQIK